MTRVLVTGSSGFIGQHLIAALTRRGYEVSGIDIRAPKTEPDGFVHYFCDLRDAGALVETIRSIAPEMVLHLAARTDLEERENLNGYAANIEGVENLIAAIRATPSIQRSVCTSSQLVCQMGYRPAHDEDYRPTTLYGQSKVRTEQIWRGHDGGGVEWCIVRPTTIWGPGMYAHYLTLFRMIRKGWYFHAGKGPTWKSYGYVGNTVQQYLQLMRAPAEQIHGRTLYLADYEPIALEDWVNTFQRAMSAPRVKTAPRAMAVAGAKVGDMLNHLGYERFPFNSFRLRNVVTAHQVDLSPTREICGELPYTTEQGVAATVDWLDSVWGENGR